MTAISDTDSVAARVALGGRSLRQHTARGAVVNAAYTVALGLLSLVRGFVLAAFVTRADYGVWGILLVTLGTLVWLKQVGIGDKYIQQEDVDQEAAFQKAFTLELGFTAIFMVLLAVAVPVIAAVYGETSLLAPGLVMVLLLPATALQAPIWIFYRQMRFLRQRLLQGIEPIVGFAVAVALAIAGAGYWAMIAGALAGAWVSALAALWMCPFRLRLRYDRGALRSYARFSWPLYVATGGGLVMAQSAMLTTEAKLGLAAAGALTLASQITQFTDRVDTIITGTLYPAICAVNDRVELLHESFVKSNRLALIWAVPFGVGLSLFASDLVTFAIGERWRPAVVVLQVYGLTAAFGHLGFNWDAYYRARGDTRPVAIAAILAVSAFLAASIPLLWAYGLAGLAAAVAIQAAVHLTVRGYYLARLFHGFSLVGHALRAIAPTVPAAAIVLALRMAMDGERTGALAAAELGLFIAVAACCTTLLEGRLLRETLGYVRPR